MTLLDNIVQSAEAQADLAALWLYGSRARGDHHSASDYDLAVAYASWLDDPFERRLRPELLAQSWEDLFELPESTISIADLGIAPIPLGMSILLDGKLLVDKQPGIRMTQESRILSRWEHDYLYHEQRFGREHP